jgi:hypothetical protein
MCWELDLGGSLARSTERRSNYLRNPYVAASSRNVAEAPVYHRRLCFVLVLGLVVIYS